MRPRRAPVTKTLRPRPPLTRFADILLLSLLLAACGGGSESRSETASASAGDADDEDIDACTLLTTEEIQAAAGWAPDTSASKAYGTIRTCAYHGKEEVKLSVVLVVATPAATPQFQAKRPRIHHTLLAGR